MQPNQIGNCLQDSGASNSQLLRTGFAVAAAGQIEHCIRRFAGVREDRRKPLALGHGLAMGAEYNHAPSSGKLPRTR